MRGRGDGGVPVSFFSFQDVLLSLIGIAIVIAMVLILQVAKATATAVQSVRTLVEAEVPLDEQQRVLQDKVAALTAAIEDAQARPDADPLSERTTLRREMRARAGELETLEARLRELEDQMREILVRNPRASALREFLELTRRRDALAAALDGVERRKQIAFILDDAEPLRPIVLEISGSRIVVSDVGNGASMRVAAGTMDSQCMQALRLYSMLAGDAPSYILMIVAPSGRAMYRSIVQAILAMPEESRPRYGVDLIPEGAFVSSEFPAAAPGGQR